MKSFARYVEKYQNSKLVLIGPVSDRSYFEEVMRNAEELEVKDKLLFNDGLQPDDPLLVSAYKAADVFVLPSRHEPFGIVIL